MTIHTSLAPRLKAFSEGFYLLGTSILLPHKVIGWCLGKVGKTLSVAKEFFHLKEKIKIGRNNSGK